MRSWVEGQTQHSGRRQTDTQKQSCPERQPFLIPLLLTRARLPPRPHPAVCSGIPGPHQNPKGQLYPRPRVGPLVICFMLLPQHSLSDHSIPLPYGPNPVTLCAPSPIQTRPGHAVSWSPMQLTTQPAPSLHRIKLVTQSTPVATQTKPGSSTPLCLKQASSTCTGATRMQA